MRGRRSLTLLFLRREKRGGRGAVDSSVDSLRLQQRVQLLYFLQPTSTQGREEGRESERREAPRAANARPMLVGFLHGVDEVLLVHLSAHTSQSAINRGGHLLLLRRRLRCRLLWERLPLRRRLRLMLSCRRHAILEMLAPCVQNKSRIVASISHQQLSI